MPKKLKLIGKISFSISSEKGKFLEPMTSLILTHNYIKAGFYWFACQKIYKDGKFEFLKNKSSNIASNAERSNSIRRNQPSPKLC